MVHYPMSNGRSINEFVRLVQAMQHAGHRMDPARYAGRPLRQRVLDRIAFALMRLALWVTGNRY